MTRLIKWLVALLIFGVTLYAVEHIVGWKNIVNNIKILAPSVLICFCCLMWVSYLLRVWRIKVALKIKDKSTRLIHLSTTHNILNILLPMRTGEAAFPLLMKNMFGVPILQSSSHLLLFRLLDLFALVSIATSLFLSHLHILFLPLCLLCSITFLYLSQTFHSVIIAMLSKSTNRKIKQITAELTLLPVKGLSFYLLVVLTYCIWLTKIFAFVVVVISLSSIPITQSVLSILAAELSTVLPIHGIAGSGTFEGAFVIAGYSFNTSTEALLTISVQLHMLLIGIASISFVMSFVAFHFVNLVSNKD